MWTVDLSCRIFLCTKSKIASLARSLPQVLWSKKKFRFTINIDNVLFYLVNTFSGNTVLLIFWSTVNVTNIYETADKGISNKSVIGIITFHNVLRTGYIQSVQNLTDPKIVLWHVCNSLKTPLLYLCTYFFRFSAFRNY